MSVASNSFCAMGSPYPDAEELAEQIIEDVAKARGPEGNCTTCWGPLAGVKRSKDNPEECADCAALADPNEI